MIGLSAEIIGTSRSQAGGHKLAHGIIVEKMFGKGLDSEITGTDSWAGLKREKYY